MMQKLTVVFAVLALMLCGCGKTPVPETTAPQQTTAPVETTAPAETEAPTEAIETTVPVETEPTEPVPTETIYVLTRLTSLNEDGEGGWFEGWHMDYTYDESGRCTGQTEILSDGSISWYCTITYAWEGDTLLITTTQPSGDASTNRETYDENGNLISKHAGGLHFTYTYDEAGNLLSEEEKSGGDPGVRRREYTYDDQGRKLTSHSYWNGEPDGRTEYAYDDRGRLTGSKSYDENDDLTSYTECTWEGNVCTEWQYMPDGNHAYTWITTYDDADRVIRVEQSNGFMSSAKEYTYEPIEIIP